MCLWISPSRGAKGFDLSVGTDETPENGIYLHPTSRTSVRWEEQIRILNEYKQLCLLMQNFLHHNDTVAFLFVLADHAVVCTTEADIFIGSVGF